MPDPIEGMLSQILTDTSRSGRVSKWRPLATGFLVAVPVAFLWSTGIDAEFNWSPKILPWVVVVSSVIAVGCYYLSLGSGRLARFGVWGSAILAFVALVMARDASASFNLFVPGADDWLYAKSCGIFGVLASMTTSLGLLSGLFCLGRPLERGVRLATALAASSVGVAMLYFYCPMGDVFHLVVGHFGMFAATIACSVAVAELFYVLAVRHRLGPLSKKFSRLRDFDKVP
jgi:hypothetical protein